jgi:hypothetical protein
MKYIAIINMEKHQPGYLNRKNQWMKLHLSMFWDAGFSMLCEVDKMRFMTLIMIQMKTKKAIPVDTEYLKKFGMNFGYRGRRLNSTIEQLIEAELIEIRATIELEQGENRARSGGEQGEIRARSGRDQGENRARSGRDQGEISESPLLPEKDLGRAFYKEKKRKDKNKIYIKDDPPNLAQIKDYISKKGYDVDGQYFLDVYENANPPWSNKKGELMRSWKSGKVIY